MSYPNDVPASTFESSSDNLAFDKYREEVCFGNEVSDQVSVNNLNSIATRTQKLILYLKNTFPDQNWGQYLNSSNELIWEKIIVSGHSQGSGHAGYLGKKKLVDRVVMFSGPNDYSTYFNAPANWLKEPGQTPSSKHFALLHRKDQISDFDKQVANLRSLNLLTASQNQLRQKIFKHHTKMPTRFQLIFPLFQITPPL